MTLTADRWVPVSILVALAITGGYSESVQAERGVMHSRLEIGEEQRGAIAHNHMPESANITQPEATEEPSSHEMPTGLDTMPAMPGHSSSMEHEHGTFEIPAGQTIPTVNLIIHPDARQGWNLEVQVTSFQFAPEQVNQPNSTATEGHAHLYIDGEKITRLYSNWYYLSTLPSGSHEITVSLNTNGHETLTYQGQPIQDTEILEVSDEQP